MLQAQQRSLIIFALFFASYLCVIGHLFGMQIRKHLFFSNLAEKQYLSSVIITPERAAILDRNGIPLALNRMAVSAFMTPAKINMHAGLQDFLQLHFPHAYTRYTADPHRSFMFIQRNITPAQAELIDAAGPEEIQLVQEPHRTYPFPALGAVVGVTNIDNNGVLGIEYCYDTQLKGTPSTYKLKKDARSRYFYFEKKNEQIGLNSLPVSLTLDANLQFLVHEELENTVKKFNAKQGSVIILDPKTGEIYAMANYPTFNPNAMQHIDMNLTKNYCIAEQYELGSVIKVFAALAALEEGVVTTDEIIDCGNTKTTFLNGRKINTTVAHGKLTFSQVIQKSNNIGIAYIAQRLNTTLYEHYVKLGFGAQTGIPLPGEQKGYVAAPEQWSKQSVISLSYGYEISATLLQLACAFAIIANDGKKISPCIIKDAGMNVSEEPLYSAQAIADIKEILKLTTLQGTAQKARLNGYTIMCKTGTANLLENGAYVHTKNSYTCAGILEKNNYSRVIVTHVRESSTPGLYASQVAAPLFEKIAQKTVIHDKII